MNYSEYSEKRDELYALLEEELKARNIRFYYAMNMLHIYDPDSLEGKATIWVRRNRGQMARVNEPIINVRATSRTTVTYREKSDRTYSINKAVDKAIEYARKDGQAKKAQLEKDVKVEEAIRTVRKAFPKARISVGGKLTLRIDFGNTPKDHITARLHVEDMSFHIEMKVNKSGVGLDDLRRLSDRMLEISTQFQREK